MNTSTSRVMAALMGAYAPSLSVLPTQQPAMHPKTWFVLPGPQLSYTSDGVNYTPYFTTFPLGPHYGCKSKDKS